ncbi:BgTH12-04940 [Blumeria graminis f. sp. triticale]|uniref:BgTH12-04940 n=1 Tax=Blumeria graminis f. sp. triticale TaxID=1689686 RepID=A0A9W4D1R9_BLUGR|nr:BgTH12-04940 [Blumeria graminis f. sp. triticale]
MPSGMPKMTRCAPGTKSHGPDEVLDVAYLQGLLGDVRTGIQNGKGRKRELSDQNAKLQKYVKNLRREEEELLAKIDYIKNELCKEKSRAAWLKQHSKRSSESRSMGQNSNGFQHFLPDNHWIHHSSYPKNRVFSPAPYSQGNTYHFQHPPVPPHPPPSNYVPNPHYPQSGNPLYNGFPGPQYYPGRMGVPQYGY